MKRSCQSQIHLLCDFIKHSRLLPCLNQALLYYIMMYTETSHLQTGSLQWKYPTNTKFFISIINTIDSKKKKPNNGVGLTTCNQLIPGESRQLATCDARAKGIGPPPYFGHLLRNNDIWVPLLMPQNKFDHPTSKLFLYMHFFK